VGKLVIAISLLFLALVVGVGFTLEVASETFAPDPPFPLGPDGPEPDEGGDGDVVIHLGKDDPSKKKPPLFDDTKDPAGLPHDGILTSTERERLTDEGYLPYTMKDGETLRDVARRYLGKEKLWTLLQEHNRTTVLNPRQVRAGTEIQIPYWLREEF
jgi:nucleoid-associated protein YgaU